MRRRASQAILLALVGWMLLGWPGPSLSAAETPGKDLRRKKQKLERLESAAEEIQKELERTRERRKGTRNAIYELEERIAQLRQRRAGNRQALERVRSRLRELEGRRKRLRARVDEHRERLAGYLEAAYRGGHHGFLRQLFGHGDPTAMRRALTYLGYLHRHRQREVARLRADRERLRDVGERLEARRAKARKLEEKLADQERSLERRMAEREKLLAKLEERARKKEDRLSAIRADQKSLRRVLERLRQEGVLVDIENKRMADLKGKLSLPVEQAEILARFGSSREGRAMRWQGLLLGAEAGTEVRAVFRGRIAYADHFRGYGLLVIVDHGDGLLSLYAHNRALFKEVGEWVETGGLLAEVGRTGGRERSATYFEIRRQGQPVNPLKWCRAPGPQQGRLSTPSHERLLWALR